jgi:predicted RNase H-like nuclease
MHIGIDGCRGGWLVATIEEKGTLHHHLIKNLNELLHLNPTLALIDIPLHFADATYRNCEVGAQALLGPKKRASIFYTPHREAVYAATYAEANELNKEHTGKGVSKQTWNICNKIKEAVQFTTENLSYPILEAHPELCFYWLNYQQPLLSKKASPEGIKDRLTIITNYNQDYQEVVENTVQKTKRKDVKPDDIIDATILAIRAKMNNLQTVPTGAKAGYIGCIVF